MPKPSAIVFDLGKVLLNFDYTVAARAIGKDTRLSLETAKQFIGQNDLLARYETGQLTREKFFGEICAATGYCGTIDSFAGYFTNIFTEIPAMIELHAALRRRGYPTYIFSNTNELQLTFIRERFPFFASFDGYVLSYEVGAMKPDAKIYETLEKLAGKRGNELLYIDDRPENIAAGKARGWQTILQETPEKTIAAVATLGLL